MILPNEANKPFIITVFFRMASSGRRALLSRRSGSFHFHAFAAFILGEVVAEQTIGSLRGLVVGCLVGPCALRIEDVGGNTGTFRQHLESEDRVRCVFARDSAPL